MGCGCRKEKKRPCGCKDCGSYTLDPMGTYRTPGGDQLEFDPPRDHRRVRGGESLGTRLERAWYGAHKNEAPKGAPPIGVKLDSVATEGQGPMGTGGSGGAVGARPPNGEVPIGVRPSVDEPASINLAQIDRPTPPPATPYGAIPVELLHERVFGVGLPGAQSVSPVGPVSVSANSERALRQYFPPVPAPQGACFVNGFDPSWGEPPATYQTIPVIFDQDLGAYLFDRAHASGNWRVGASGTSGVTGAWMQNVASRYATGFMLQPYKIPGQGGPDGPWYFRWIPQRREVSCPSE